MKNPLIPIFLFWAISMGAVLIFRSSIVTVADIKKSLILNEYYQEKDEEDDWGNIKFNVIQITKTSKSKERIIYRVVFTYTNGNIQYHNDIYNSFEVGFMLFDYSNKNGRFKLKDKYRKFLK